MPTKSARGLTDEFVQLMWPWEAAQYPGKYRALAALLQIAPSYARDLMQARDPLPQKHATRLPAFIEARIALERSLLERLRLHIEQQERRHSLEPHPGYRRGLQAYRLRKAPERAARAQGSRGGAG